MANILVVGGAGYVGGTACTWLLDRGHKVWVLDDLSRGHHEWIDRLPGLAGFVQARAGDSTKVETLLRRERFDCVMHFAAFALVAESVAQPAMYRENNVDQTRALLDSMLRAGVKKFIFSSTCAVFGDPGLARIPEDAPKSPLNPYGATKLEVEGILAQLAREQGLQSVALRYFNAAGTEPQGRVGEWHDPETHIIPRVLQAAMRDEAVELYGTDYATPDGSCVRDYIHVCDLAQAHEAAMHRLLALPAGAPGQFEAFNLGSQNGYSVREIIAACERTIGRKLRVTEKPRRPGDPPMLVGDAMRAKKELGFKASYGLDTILAAAWKWEQSVGSLAHGRKAVFLDRDGTINVDPGYLSHPDQMQLLPGVAEAIAALRHAGYMIVVVSNQSGVGRGIFKQDMLPRIHARMEELLAPHGAYVDRYELCIHRPEDECECRKPKAKLLVDAARAMGVALDRSYMVGDKRSDVQAGQAAGCRGAVLVRTGHGVTDEATLTPGDAQFVGADLPEAVGWILGQGGR